MDRVDKAAALVNDKNVVVHDQRCTLPLSQRFDCPQLAKWSVPSSCHNNKTHQTTEPLRAIARFDKVLFVLGTVFNM